VTVSEAVADVSLARRFAALFIDWILCLLVTFAFGVAPRTAGPWPVLVLIFVYAFFAGLFAQTPGMAVVGIRCVSVADGGRIGVLRGALRGFLLALVIPAILMDADRRGWHDKAAGSVIVRNAAAER
jgi:uncharacterized RDD family membrane protein YckC